MSASVDVLLVEDEADLAAATRDYLSAFGLRVTLNQIGRASCRERV